MKFCAREVRAVRQTDRQTDSHPVGQSEMGLRLKLRRTNRGADCIEGQGVDGSFPPTCPSARLANTP